MTSQGYDTDTSIFKWNSSNMIPAAEKGLVLIGTQNIVSVSWHPNFHMAG